MTKCSLLGLPIRWTPQAQGFKGQAFAVQPPTSLTDNIRGSEEREKNNKRSESEAGGVEGMVDDCSSVCSVLDSTRKEAEVEKAIETCCVTFIPL